MTKVRKDLKIKSLDTNDFKNKDLSIQLSLDGFSFCILNKTSTKVEAFSNYTFTEPASTPQLLLEYIEQIFQEDELLQNEFNAVKVIHHNNLVSLVPTNYFNEAYLEDYLKYNIKLLKDDYIAFDTLEQTKTNTVYVPFVNVNNFFFSKFGEFEYSHSASILIDKLLLNFKDEQGLKFFVNVHSSNFEIVVISEEKLTFFNSFQFKTKEDFIYYILFTAEQLKLNPDDFNLILMGEIEKTSELYTIVHQYIRHVDFFSNDNPKLTEAFSELSKHSNFTLLN